VKTCNRCGAAKQLLDFPPDKQNTDGRKGKCRACVLARQRELRAAHPETERAWVAANHERVLSQKRSHRERNSDRLRRENRERARRARSTEEGLERSRQVARRHYAKNRIALLISDKQRAQRDRQKIRARNAVSRALRTGRLVRASSCSACGRTERKLQAHHADYARPLDVIWLCSPCHKREHLKEHAA
jgi:hypothetical protein